MLYIPWMVILRDHNIKKISFENFDFSAVQSEMSGVKNCISRLCTKNSLGDNPPPPPELIPKWGEKHVNTAIPKWGEKHVNTA